MATAGALNRDLKDNFESDAETLIEGGETRWGKISAESSLFFHSCIIFYYEEELKFPNSS
jgi:hypothetical protein